MSKPGRRLISLLSICCAAWAAAAAAGGADRPAPAPNRVTLPANTSPALILVEEARAGAPSSWLAATGVLVSDARSLQDVNAYLTGEVRQVFVRAGDSVKAGAPLATIYSPELVATQKSYLAMVENKEQLQFLREAGRLADYMKDARENLRWWGLTEADIGALERHSRLVQEVVLRAPVPGLVEQVLVEPGGLINAGDRAMKAFIVTGKPVARILAAAEPYRIEGSVYADQLPLLRVGSRVKVTGPGPRTFERRIGEILPDIEAASQRARFRVSLDAATPWPRGTALRLEVEVPRTEGTWVPREAVLGQHIAPAVYVRLAPQVYERRRVTVLAAAGGALQVSGVAPREAVVTAGKAVLEGALRLGAAPSRSSGHHSH